MYNISLIPMTQALCCKFYENFQRDEAIYMDASRFSPYVYSPKTAVEYFQKQQAKKRVYLAIMLDDRPVGEISFKDVSKESAVLSIHLQNDSVKNMGIGTKAEKLALQYAFEVLQLSQVNADVVLKNEKSMHVLEKAGFKFLYQKDIFRYYRCKAEDFYNKS